MSTYRERRMERAERLRGWSSRNEAAADGRRAEVDRIAGMIPMGQPILVGHHSEKRHRRDIAKIDNGMRASIDLRDKAARQQQSAAEIEAQAARAIYSDDPDAIERLTAKLAALEGERERKKLARAQARKDLREELKGKTAWEREQRMPFAQYEIQNLGGLITTTRQRIERLKREQVSGPRDRMITARYAGECADCGAAIERGQLIRYNRQQGARCAPGCATEEG